MNVLIVQQLSWGLNVGHAVARALSREGHRLSALVYGLQANEFIVSQTDVQYEGVYFADPLYDEGSEVVSADRVREMEGRYHLDSIWRVIYSDRLLLLTFLDSRHFVPRKPVSNEYLLSVCSRTYQFVHAMMDQVKPDYVLAPIIGCLANYLLYLECRTRGIPFFTIGFSGFGDYRFVADDLYQCSTRIEARSQALRSRPEVSPQYEEARRIYSAIRRNEAETKPIHVCDPAPRRPAERWLETVREVVLFPARAARTLFSGGRAMAFQNIWMPANSGWNRVRSLLVNLRERFVPRDEQGDCPTTLQNGSFRYMYFPLHFEPEVALLVFGPEYVNQIELCRRVAQALPAGVRLLVKEHPAMVSSRPHRFYDDLRGLPNAELVHSSVPSHEIFTSERCVGVLVVSSSVGFEAAMSGRPVILLAPAVYASLPTVYRADSLETAIEKIAWLCRGGRARDPGEVDRENLAHICAVLEHSFSLDHYRRWIYGEGEFDADVFVRAVHDMLKGRDV